MTGSNSFPRRLLEHAQLADRLLGALAGEKGRVEFTHPDDRMMLEVVLANARACANGCRLLADRANRRDG